MEIGVVEWVKRKKLKWLGHIERMKSEGFMKKVYVSEIKGPSRRGRPLGKWNDRLKKYMSGRGATRRGGLEQAMRECVFGKGEVEAPLPWPPLCGMFLEGARHQSYKYINK